MTLREYFFYNQIQIKDFSLLVDYNPSYISSVSRGVYKPSKKFARIIEKVTNGQVKAHEVFLPGMVSTKAKSLATDQEIEKTA